MYVEQSGRMREEDEDISWLDVTVGEARCHFRRYPERQRGGAGQVWKLKRHRGSFLSGARGINCCPNYKPANWFWLFSAHFWQVRLWDKEDFPVNTEHGNKCRNINGSSSIDHGNCYFWDDFSGLERRLQGIINLLI